MNTMERTAKFNREKKSFKIKVSEFQHAQNVIPELKALLDSLRLKVEGKQVTDINSRLMKIFKLKLKVEKKLKISSKYSRMVLKSLTQYHWTSEERNEKKFLGEKCLSFQN